MAVTEAYAGSETVSTTEWSLTTDTSGPDAATTAGVYQLFLDLSAMAAGDEFRVRCYEKVQAADTQRVVWEKSFIGVQNEPNQASPAIMLINGFDFTLLKVAGTDRAITWSIRKG